VGADALQANTTASANTAVGYQASYSNTTAQENTAIGYFALKNTTTGGQNTAGGVNSLLANSTGINNVAFGYLALQGNTTASNNTAVGYRSSNTNTTGANNTSFGAVTLFLNTTGNYNTAIGGQGSNGYSTMYANTTGSFNTAVGNEALSSNTTASNNTAVGYQAGYTNSTGANLTLIGYQAGYTNQGTSSIAIGNGAGKTNQGSYSICLGANTNSTLNNTVVIYSEGISGNPLRAKYVVRWMLSELGKNVPYDYVNTWGKNELVYYFNSEPKIVNNPSDFFKFLTVIYINPNIKNNNLNQRSNYCYTYRKSYYHNNVNIIHPTNSFEITRSHSQEDYIKIFNTYKYFVSYDPLTFLSIIAPLCGCISIIHPVKNVTKEGWLKNSALYQYFKEKGNFNIYGIAYGDSLEELEFAKKTIDGVPYVTLETKNPDGTRAGDIKVYNYGELERLRQGEPVEPLGILVDGKLQRI
jgi:hypothetical protein